MQKNFTGIDGFTSFVIEKEVGGGDIRLRWLENDSQVGTLEFCLSGGRSSYTLRVLYAILEGSDDYGGVVSRTKRISDELQRAFEVINDQDGTQVIFEDPASRKHIAINLGTHPLIRRIFQGVAHAMKQDNKEKPLE